MGYSHALILQGFNFNYLFITSVFLLLISHIVNGIYWATLLKNDTKVKLLL